MKNRNLEHTNNWATPPVFYEELNREFNFDFDPCPYTTEDIIDETDGLLKEWGERNYINPPYERKLKEKFIAKAFYESQKGKLCVMLLPVSTSSKIFHSIIKPHAKEIRFLEGRLPFIGINKYGQYVNWHLWNNSAPDNAVHVKAKGQHDSMIVIFKG